VTIQLPTKPLYTNLLGQPVFWIGGAASGDRTENDVLLLVMHHTVGVDSREYLADNPLNSSATYLVGSYADTGDKPRIYKYMSARTAIPYTQGFGSLGGVARGPNPAAISIEVEGMGGATPFRDDVLTAAAKLAASIIKDWHDARGRNLLLIGHDHLDSYYRKDRHDDPHFDWTRFTQQVYSFVGGLSGNVKGWGRA
jgi:N-acetyl-anhydromuramyl-L-alanine amidase AmpD